MIKQGISQYIVMGYSNSQCKRGEVGENPQWVLAQKGIDDIEKYYVSLFERQFLFKVRLSNHSGPVGKLLVLDQSSRLANDDDMPGVLDVGGRLPLSGKSTGRALPGAADLVAYLAGGDRESHPK